MDFVVRRFFKLLERDYGMTISYKRNKGSYSLLIHNPNPTLAELILNITYLSIIGNEVAKDDDGNTILRPITETVRLASGVSFTDGSKGICINLDTDNYANKIIKLDSCIKRYFEDHSPIDAINGNH